jgi:predicted RNase H-like HicB family nuclease
LEAGSAKRQPYAIPTSDEAWDGHGFVSRKQGPFKIRSREYPQASGVEVTKGYLVVFSKCTGSNFSGHAPDVPGCISAADTLPEIAKMMREALEFHFEGMAAHGEPIPEPLTMNVLFRPEDFVDVEYFVVQKIDVNLPSARDSEQISAHRAA